MKSNIRAFKNHVKASLLPIIAIGIMLQYACIVKAQTQQKSQQQTTEVTAKSQALDSSLWVNGNRAKPSVPVNEYLDFLLDDPLTNLDVPNTLHAPIALEADTGYDQLIYDNNRDWVDRMATYKNGKRNFVKSIDYPQEAIDNGIEGLVKVFFVVEPNGSTSNIKILKSLNYWCDQAVVNAVRKAKFNPAVADGRAVRVHCILPVYFGLNNLPS